MVLFQQGQTAERLQTFCRCLKKTLSIAIFPLYDSEVGLEFFKPLGYVLTIQILASSLFIEKSTLAFANTKHSRHSEQDK